MWSDRRTGGTVRTPSPTSPMGGPKRIAAIAGDSVAPVASVIDVDAKRVTEAIDKERSRTHTSGVPDARAALQIRDPRNRERFLRVSWHPSRRTIVVSQWRDGLCVASTPVEIEELPALIGLLVQVLEDAENTSIPAAPPSVA